MRILANMTNEDLAFYTRQPTAKALREKVMRDGIYNPEGNKEAAAFVAKRAGEKSAARVVISPEARALYTKAREPEAASGKDSLTVTKSPAGVNRFIVHFDNTAFLHRAVTRGYVEVNGKRLTFTDDEKKSLLAVDEKTVKANEKAFMQSVMQYNAAVTRQQADAVQTMSAKQSRAMAAASRIMHGKKVSPADEKELMEVSPELYAMAKSAGMLRPNRRKSDEDVRASKEHDAARAAEQAAKDYNIPTIAAPDYETQLHVSLEGGDIRVLSMGTNAAVD